MSIINNNLSGGRNAWPSNTGQAGNNFLTNQGGPSRPRDSDGNVINLGTFGQRPGPASGVNFNSFVNNIRNNADSLRRSLVEIRSFQSAEDDTSLIRAFNNMANAFNNLVSRARDVTGQEVSLLERGLIELAQSSSASLRRIGITLGLDGTMRLDRNRMQAAAERGDLDRFLTQNRRPNSLMDQLARAADAIGRSPESFLGSGLNGTI